MHKFQLSRRAALVGTIVSAVLSSGPTLAAPPAKIGIAYSRDGGATTTNSVYTLIVEMSLPAGKYIVTGRGTIQNQQAATDTVSCNVYAGAAAVFVDANTTTVPSGEYGALAFNGVATLATAGNLWVECIASQGPSGSFASARLTATTAADVIDLP
jgi:hypothetical protein